MNAPQTASESSDFAANNRAYLQAGLDWLREELLRLSREEDPRANPLADDGHAARRGAATAGIQEAHRRFEDASRLLPEPALVRLARRFGLSEFEQKVILLLVAMELDESMPAMIAAAQSDRSRHFPTFALALAMFCEGSWDALSVIGPLRRLNLVEVHSGGTAPLLTSPLRLSERIADYVKGLNYLDPRLEEMTSPIEGAERIPVSQFEVSSALGTWLSHSPPQGIMQLMGDDLASKRDVLISAAHSAGMYVRRIALDSMPDGAHQLGDLARLWEREACLIPLVLFVEKADAAGDPAMQAQLWRHFSGLSSPVVIDVRTPSVEGGVAAILEVNRPTQSEQQSRWSELLDAWTVLGSEESRTCAARLAGEFSLAASGIEACTAEIAAKGATSADESLAHVWPICVAHSRGVLEQLAQRIEPQADFEDVMLPAADRAQLHTLVEHARNRGRVLGEFGFREAHSRGLGTTALFHGESGTGKTMAAEAVANTLKLDLYRIDLSTVVSKYIGDSAKKMREVFDAAERGGCVLLFDEADALFGRRSEVKDSHDRYANVEVNYLLTRMESFGGVAILATNMKHALDPAFLRRLRFVIRFPFPGFAERLAIWRSVFPGRTPLGALDYERLAAFSLSGGSIFNAALMASHAAVRDHANVEMSHVLEAIRHELRKLERPAAESAAALPRKLMRARDAASCT